jgi:integrase
LGYWGAYTRHLDPEEHTPGKRNTQKIERKHLTLRTRIKRLVRKTICFSKSTQMHDIVIGLFVNRYAFGRAVPSPLSKHYPLDHQTAHHQAAREQCPDRLFRARALRGDPPASSARISGILDFDYYTGWRKSEVWKLEWKDVDMKAGVIRLPQALSKNKDSRVLVLSGVLMELIEKRWQLRVLGCPYVFHVNGQRLRNWRRTWHTACKKAGLDGTYFHDLRRTVVRNLVRAGVSDKVAMSITGHKTRSVFDRYNIVSEDDLRSTSETLTDYVASQSKASNVIPLRKKIWLHPAHFPAHWGDGTSIQGTKW